MTTSIRLREAKALLAANKLAEANNLIETVAYSLLNAENPRRTNHDNIHVHGYKEKGNINTPMELAIQNQVDRFTLAMDAIDRVPSLKVRGSHAREALTNQQIDCRQYAYQEGIDRPEIVNWKWPL